MFERRRFWVVIPLILIASVCPAIARASLDAAPCGTNGTPCKGVKKSLLMQQLEEMAQVERERLEHGGTKIHLDELPDPSPPTDFSTLFEVTQETDPLITPECRRQALEEAAKGIGAQKAHAHASKANKMFMEGLVGKRKVLLSDHLDHLAECKDFCSPLTALLLQCHIDAVERSNRLIVFFEVNKPDGSYTMPGPTRSELSRFASEMQRNGRSLMLYGRASMLGPNERFSHNRRLSEKRVAAVRAELERSGFSGGLQTAGITWDPPRLAIEEIATAYGFRDHWIERRASPQEMDQSVVVVAY
jgi:hypothetical protein